MDLDTARGEHLGEFRPHPRVVRRQNLVGVCEEVEFDAVTASIAVAEQPTEPILAGQSELDAAGAAADHGDPRAAAVTHALLQGPPAFEKTADRLDRDD